VNRLLYGQRDEPYTVITRLSQRLEAQLSPDAVLSTIVEAVAQALKVPYVAILLKQEDTFRLAASAGELVGEPQMLPLVYQKETIGQMRLAPRAPGESFTPADRRLLDELARQAGLAAHAVQLTADLQRSYEQQALAALEERQKLARELHDSVSQALYGIALGLHSARLQLERDPRKLPESLDYLLSLAEAGLAEMRALIFELHPESLETEGLVAALTRQAAALQARHEIVVSTKLCDEPDLPLRAKQELYRIAQEAMHNTVKHARANQVLLRLEQTADWIAMEVQDDGIGFNTSASFPGHLGLHSMRERVANLGGTFQIESTPGAGTRTCVRIQVTSKLK
jgi:signal transduction histidine kinase